MNQNPWWMMLGGVVLGLAAVTCCTAEGGEGGRASRDLVPAASQAADVRSGRAAIFLSPAFDYEMPAKDMRLGVFADTLAPGSADEEWVAVALRDGAVKTGRIARARLPQNVIEKREADDACRQGPQAFVRWIFGESYAINVAEDWPEEGPIQNPVHYCRYQLALVAQSKGQDVPGNLDDERDESGTVVGWKGAAMSHSAAGNLAL